MKNLENKVAVITGAASGIGRSLALKLAKEGCMLALSDVNEDGLSETVSMTGLSSEKVFIKKLDVSNEADFNTFASDVVSKFGSADILINNAGVNHNGKVIDTPTEDLKWIFDINFWGVVYGSRAFLPHMMKRPGASLVNISSLFGLVGVRGQSAYCATKFAVRGFTESLRQELKLAKAEMDVISVHPGGIKTNIAKNARMVTANGAASEAELKKFASVFDKVAKTTADQAADTIIDGIKKSRSRVLIGNDAKLLDKIQRFFPAGYDKIFAKIL